MRRSLVLPGWVSRWRPSGRPGVDIVAARGSGIDQEPLRPPGERPSPGGVLARYVDPVRRGEGGMRSSTRTRGRGRDMDGGVGAADIGVRICLLGDFTVLVAGRDVTPSAPKLRQILAVLALRYNEVVHRE